MTRVLITGSVSLLGSGLIKKLPKLGQLFLTYHKNQSPQKELKSFQLDIRDKNRTLKLISQLYPEIIIHAAAVSDVDWCEQNQKEAWLVNVEGTKNVVEAAKQVRSKIVFISTNAVFNGRNPPYTEESKPSPVNFYGKTKAEGEKIIVNSGLPYLIFRLITMYGWPPAGARDNPVTWKLTKLQKGDVLSMVTDRFINPLYNLAAAETIWKAVELKKLGLFHIAGADRVSRYQWALLVAEVFGFEKSLIKPISSDFLSGLAPRPDDTTYLTHKMETELGIKPLTVREGLILMRDERPNNFSL